MRWRPATATPIMAASIGSARLIPGHAAVAQLAEQLFCKQQVTGSIPVGGSTPPGHAAGGGSEEVLGHELEDLAVCGDLVRELDDAVTLVLEDQQLGPSYRLGDLDALADRHARVVPAVDDK